jgi:glycosyltransferase involved in cell wall biosynthesis
MSSISVIIITYNEEKRLEPCLQSVAWADEIIVVDSFSEDKTVEIAQRYTDKIFRHPFKGYGSQKAFALAQAKGEWVLNVDADERVSERLKKEIKEAIKQSDIFGYYLPRQNFFCGQFIRHSGWFPDYQLRLFKRNRARFEERLVHEKVIVEGRVGRLKNPLLHYTYNSLTEFLEKMERYTELWAEEQKRKGKKGGILKGFGHGIWTFLKMYLLRLGFLDGRYGLLLASLYANYTLIKYTKLEEKWKKK